MKLVLMTHELDSHAIGRIHTVVSGEMDHRSGGGVLRRTRHQFVSAAEEKPVVKDLPDGCWGELQGGAAVLILRKRHRLDRIWICIEALNEHIGVRQTVLIDEVGKG